MSEKSDAKSTELAKSSILPKFAGSREALLGYATRFLPQIQRGASKHFNAEAAVGWFNMCITANPKLGDCTLTSILGFIKRCADLGLRFGPGMPQAHPVPFRDAKTGDMTCTFIIDYTGLLALLARIHVRCEVYKVRPGEVFEVRGGTDAKLVHEPNVFSEEAPIAYYAVFVFPDGYKKFHVMSKAQVEQVRGLAPGREGAAWRNHYDAMALKTVVKHGAKYIGVDLPEFLDAVAADNEGAKFAPAETVVQLASSASNAEVAEALKASSAKSLPATPPTVSTSGENAAVFVHADSEIPDSPAVIREAVAPAPESPERIAPPSAAQDDLSARVQARWEVLDWTQRAAVWQRLDWGEAEDLAGPLENLDPADWPLVHAAIDAVTKVSKPPKRTKQPT